MEALFTLPTLDRYKEFVQAHNLPEKIEAVTDGAKIAWLGSPSAAKIVLYCPSGGFAVPISKFHMESLHDLLKAAQTKGTDIAAGLAVHGLAPQTPYPGPFRDFFAIVAHLLKSRSPDSIFLMGDSAGGVAQLAMLLHFNHPHPGVAALPKLSPGAKFAKALLASPGLPLFTSARSMEENEGKDILTKERVSALFEMLNDSRETEGEALELPNPWYSPVSAPEDWWKALPVGEVTVVIGGNELLRDDCLTISKAIEKYHEDAVKALVFDGAVHCQFLMDRMVAAEPTKSPYSNAITEWFENI